MQIPSGARHAPATARNREAILQVLRAVLPAAGTVLEIASGTGEHAAYFAAQLPEVTWQPSDAADEQLASIRAWRAQAAVANLRDPVLLDVEHEPWPFDSADAIVCCNMIHIAPWSACQALLSGGGRRLPPGGVLTLYGPFKRGGRHTADSNARFDEGLRAQDPRWGVRDLDAVTSEAERAGLTVTQVIAMPANNLSVVLVRAPHL